MCLVFSKILGIPHAHIIADAEPPSGAGATTRPRDCQLYCGETEELLRQSEGRKGGDLGQGLGLSLFEEWWQEYLQAKQ